MNWIDELKPGDNVTVVTNSAYNYRSVGVVAKTTKTQVVLKDGRRFRKDNCRLVGQSSSWAWTEIEQATPERLNEVEYATLVDKLERRKWKAYKFETLRAVMKILEEEQGE